MVNRLELGEPNEKQKMALLDRHKYICFGGARGGGKSWFVQRKAISGCYKYPGIKIIIARKTYPELINNHINEFISILKCYHADKNKRLARYNGTDKEIVFLNGSRIKFMYCDNEKALGRWQGNQCDWLFIDEATQFDEETFKKMCACVRGVNNIPKRIYLTCNPDNIGLQWVKRLFIDRNFEDNEDPNDYSFIQSLVQDNKALMATNPDYIKNLEALPLKIRQAWLEGRWDVFSGQYFEEFRNRPEHYHDKRWTHVIEPFPIPSGWKIYRAFDWGYSKPSACCYFAMDYEGVMYHFHEIYFYSGEPNEGAKLVPDEVFKRIKDYETSELKGRHIYGIADPAIWNKGTGYSINDFAERNGIYFEKADNNRIQGWMQCHYRLAFDENGFPMFYVFNTCKNFIRTIPLMMYDEHKPEDLNSDLEDHIADAWRYMCVYRAIKPRRAFTYERREDNPLDLPTTRRKIYEE